MFQLSSSGESTAMAIGLLVVLAVTTFGLLRAAKSNADSAVRIRSDDRGRTNRR